MNVRQKGVAFFVFLLNIYRNKWEPGVCAYVKGKGKGGKGSEAARQAKKAKTKRKKGSEGEVIRRAIWTILE